MTFDIYLKSLLDPAEHDFYERHGFDFERARKEDEHLAELIYYVYGFVFYQARCIRDDDWPNKDCMQWKHFTGMI